MSIVGLKQFKIFINESVGSFGYEYYVNKITELKT